jgi:RNA polymerase sigma-70 factor (ECF subfamily)
VTDPGVPSYSGESTISRTSISLLERARAAEQAAWERLVVLYSPLVWGWCRRQGLQEADAADVGQEVFRAVAGNLSTFRHDAQQGSFRGWLKTITKSKIVDFLRAKRSSPDGRGGSDAYEQLLALQESPVDDTLSDDLRLLYQRALELIRSEFNEVHWQAFQRTAVEGRKGTEVARELGISPDVVYNARSRIAHRLRQEFAELLDDPPASANRHPSRRRE